MDISDKVSSDTSVTDKQPLLTPNQAPINVVDATPDDFSRRGCPSILKVFI